MSSPIDDYYDLSSLVDDDIILVCVLIQMSRIIPNKAILSSLEKLSLRKYQGDLDFLLNLKTETIKDLSNAFKPMVNKFRDDEMSENITNLLDVIEYKDIKKCLSIKQTTYSNKRFDIIKKLDFGRVMDFLCPITLLKFRA